MRLALLAAHIQLFAQLPRQAHLGPALAPGRGEHLHVRALPEQQIVPAQGLAQGFVFEKTDF